MLYEQGDNYLELYITQLLDRLFQTIVYTGTYLCCIRTKKNNKFPKKGCYIIYDKKYSYSIPIYIGSSNNLLGRILNHFRDYDKFVPGMAGNYIRDAKKSVKGQKYLKMRNKIIDYCKTNYFVKIVIPISVLESKNIRSIEYILINELCPKFNKLREKR